MKALKHIYLTAFVALALTACDSDIDQVFVLPTDDVELAGASTDIILTPDNPQGLALTIYWSGDGRLALSDAAINAPVNAAETTIELSADETFTAPLELAVDKNVRSRQFMCEELNSLLGRLGFPANEPAPLWIRVRTKLAANVDPTYSNALRVNVQSYRISLNLGRVLNSDWSETSVTLASPEENGIYTGFMGVSGWYNWWFRENNNVTWGNLGVDGKSFYASSADDHWNFWFPGETGCYFTTLNTVEGWWSALYISSLSVSGDLSGDMTYNKAANQWTLTVNMASESTVNITVAGQGTLYDVNTTADGPGVAQTVGFSGSATGLSFGNTGAPVSVTLPAGETTLVLDLSNPLQWTIGAGEAAPEPAIDSHLYFSGLVTWDGFDDYLTLYNESSLSYGGAHWIDSEWGYRVYPQPDWTPCYKATDGSDGLAGSLVLAESDGNVPAPAKGLYVMDFSLANLNYTLTAVSAVSFTGLNDDWNEHEMTQSADNPEVFTGEFIKEKETPWGVKVLINHDWSLFFGGGETEGTLYLGHSDATSGFTGDNALETGKTYIITVDLGKQTYTYSLK
ncbi:MAG: DUF5114 domain-containing protein [Firmicutes bacterium]|nr:DUF5114 domain-containing protein [Bacillota bacterium]MCM1401516.1 DUF5114 domain-containing protein [Bacteroides sp.]MCM1477366.1 DUF5114 domain-containing protein [Bacteroides sp.]